MVDAPQAPVIKEIQPEAKEVPQAPQKPSVVPQTPPESAPPTKPKKKLKLKIFIVRRRNRRGKSSCS
jgi:hypothetical protein